jgi:glycosyltransferase involved in cell wall biosynthesis
VRFLVCSSLPRDSGCALRARHLAVALRRLGHEVRQPPLPTSKPLFLDYLLTGLYALPWTLFGRFDCALVIKPYPTLLWPLLLRRWTAGGRIGVDVDDVDSGFRSGLAGRLLAAIQRPLPARCDFVTTHNDALQAHIEAFHGVPARRILRLDQGVDLALYRPLPAAERARLRAEALRTTGFPDGPLLVYTGHLNVASELEVLLDLWPGLLKDCPSARLVVAGGGPWLVRYRDRAARCAPPGTVFFTGHQTPEQVNDWLNAGDLAPIFYRATEANRFRVSMKMRECLAAGIPVVANDFGDLAQFRSVTRSCATPPGAFEEAIREAILRPPDREATASRGRALIEEQWNWDSIAHQFVLSLQRLESAGTFGTAKAKRQPRPD